MKHLTADYGAIRDMVIDGMTVPPGRPDDAFWQGAQWAYGQVRETLAHIGACPHCDAASGERCRDDRGEYRSGVHTSRVVFPTEDLLPHPSMRCELGEHSGCLFAHSGCPCSCHRATPSDEHWNPTTATPGCDWCGEADCGFCASLGA